VAFKRADFSETLFDASGRRKYLSASEWRQFVNAAASAEPRARAFCRVLAFTGCRISEALSLTPTSLDPATGCIVLRTLKRRKRVFRAVPVPTFLLRELSALPVSWARTSAYGIGAVKPVGSGSKRRWLLLGSKGRTHRRRGYGTDSVSPPPKRISRLALHSAGWGMHGWKRRRSTNTR
jgi:integrase